MENPFTALGEAIHDGLDRLHKRADTVEGDVGTVKADLKAFAEEVKGELVKLEDFGDRLAKLEAIFAPEAVAAVTDKVSSAGGDVPKPVDPTPKPDTEAPAPVVDLSAGTTTHTAADGTVTTLDHEAGTVTAKDGDGAAVMPLPAATEAVVQAAIEAGAAVPDTVIRGADVPDTTAPAAPVI